MKWEKIGEGIDCTVWRSIEAVVVAAVRLSWPANVRESITQVYHTRLLSWSWRKVNANGSLGVLHRIDGPAESSATATLAQHEIHRYLSVKSPYELDSIYSKKPIMPCRVHWRIDGLELPFTSAKLTEMQIKIEMASACNPMMKHNIAKIAFHFGYISEQALLAMEAAATLC